MDERWLSVGEIAEYLGVSKDTVYTWRTSKEMPRTQVDRRLKLKRDHIDNWVHDGGAASSPGELGEKVHKGIVNREARA